MAKANPVSKRPERIILEVAPIPVNICFVESLGSQRSTYVVRLQEAFLKGHCVRISAGDNYMLSQLRTAAKKSSLKLVYGVSPDSKSIYVKPIKIEGAQKSLLLLLLRDPRSMAELEARKLELDLGASLARLRTDGLCHVVREKWVLTDKDLDAIQQQ